MKLELIKITKEMMKPYYTEEEKRNAKPIDLKALSRLAKRYKKIQGEN